MDQVHRIRLLALRLLYAAMFVGILLNEWPEIVSSQHSLDHMNSIVRSVLGAVSILALIGVFHPLKMLPLLGFELVWKAIWLAFYGRILWLEGSFTDGTRGTFYTCLISVAVVLLVLPWGAVLRSLMLPAATPNSHRSEPHSGKD